MAFLDGFGSAVLGAISGAVTASPGHTPYALIPQQPENGTLQGSTAVPVTAILSVTDGSTADVQIEVATDAGFTAIVAATTLTGLSDGPLAMTAGGLVNDTQYWWHMRVSAAGAGVWSAWTPSLTFKVSISHSKAWAAIEENVGIKDNRSPLGWAALEENVGIPLVTDSDAWAAIDFNGGIEIHLYSGGFSAIDEGDVDTSTPTPIIWFLQPAAGRQGDGIEVVGYGFGDLQSTYNGALEINMGDPIGWVALSVTSWQTFPPTANAYTEDREIDVASGVIDMQHQKIGMIVPAGTIPPGYPVRVVTDGA